MSAFAFASGSHRTRHTPPEGGYWAMRASNPMIPPLPLQRHERPSGSQPTHCPKFPVFPGCQIAVPPQHAAVSRRGFDTPFYQVSINEQELNLHPC